MKHVAGLVHVLGGTLGLLLVPFTSALMTSPVMAAAGDKCLMPDNKPGLISLVPGVVEEVPQEVEQCEPLGEAPQQGYSCADGLFFNSQAGMCVANASSCSVSSTVTGTYHQGLCTVPGPTPLPTPSTPGFTADSNAGTAPAGTQQPMCVNASPFIGAAIFGVAVGSTLCYSAAGKTTNMFAYTDGDGANGGWNPFDPDSWDSLNLKDLYAQDDVTALGTITSYGGAQFFSADGKTGMQLNNSGVLMRSQDGTKIASFALDPDAITAAVENGANKSGLTVQATGSSLSATNGTSTASVGVTATAATLAATDGTSHSSVTANGTTGVAVVGHVATGSPGVSIFGSTGETGVGLLMRGSGQGGATPPTSGAADWVDILLASDNFGPQTGLGSGVLINDYGVSIRSASIGRSYNEFGSGALGQAGSVLVNVIGAGGEGSVSNYLGQAGAAGTNVLNEIGTGNGGGATTNRLGNTNAATSVTATAGSTNMSLINGAQDLRTGHGASILTDATEPVAGGTATAMLGANSRYGVVDANGQLVMVQGVAPEASASLYISNGRGITNGIVVTERGTTVSGGEANPTSVTFNDYGVRYTNAATGSPVVVTGVADGSSPFDATNLRQLDSGLASVAALAGLPGVMPGKSNSLGMALGHHGSGMAVAVGGESIFGDNGTVKYGASMSYSSGRMDTSASLGVGVSW